MNHVPDPIFPENFPGYSRESNPGSLGWQSDMLTTIPNKQDFEQFFKQMFSFSVCFSFSLIQIILAHPIKVIHVPLGAGADSDGGPGGPPSDHTTIIKFSGPVLK